MRRLEGRTAIVTGAAQGLGLAIASRLAEEGAAVWLTDVQPKVLDAAEAIGQHGLIADVSRKAEVDRLVNAALEATGRIDVLVNNAGVTHAASLLELTEADFDRVMAVNVKAMLFAIQAAAPAMIAAKSGSIVNLSSVNAVLAIPSQIAYSVSKGAVRQLTNVAALALAPHGVRVNAIGPGTIMTEMAKGVLSGNLDPVLARTPLGRVGEPEEIAAIAAFLASDEASYMTGQTVYADGGRLGLNYTMPKR